MDNLIGGKENEGRCDTGYEYLVEIGRVVVFNYIRVGVGWVSFEVWREYGLGRFSWLDSFVLGWVVIFKKICWGVWFWGWGVKVLYILF